MLFGCGRQPPAVATQAPPQLSIRPLAFAEEDPTSTNDRIRSWTVKLASVPKHHIEGLGLKALVDLGAEKNPVVTNLAALSPYHVLAARQTNILLTTKAGAYAGAISIPSATNLIARLEQTAGIDVMTPNGVSTTNAVPTRIAVLDELNVIFNRTSAPLMERTQVGLNFLVKANGRQLEAAARMDEFAGYAGPYGPSILNSITVGTRANLQTNEALLVMAPAHFNVTETIDRVPGLSAVPVLGRYFIKSQTHTNYYRLLLIVSPNP